MSSSHDGTSVNATKAGPGAPREWLFVDSTPTDDDSRRGDKMAQKRNVRSQAARVSATARLETMRKRVEGRIGRPGHRVFPVALSAEPLPRIAVEQHQKVIRQHQDHEATVTLHAHTLLGGSIPVAQAHVAIMGHFLHRFKAGSSVERPWVELVIAEAEADSSGTPSLVTIALQANASALCANDLQRPEIRRHATKLYLSAITQLQSCLRSSSWHQSVVMYTCMILTLYECIQSNDSSTRDAHVKGVAHLIEQKGPNSFMHGLEHSTFRYYRINILMVCLADRRPCFLAEAAWKTIPFSKECPPKTMSDLLIDILVEIPGLLAATEGLRTGGPSQYALIQKALELAYWVRCLISALERWKENNIWTHPAICTTPRLRNLDILALCKLGTGLDPQDAQLREALNCYLAAHLILARIAGRFGERSFAIKASLRPPYSLCELITAIIHISEEHISDSGTGLISLRVTAFPLKVAQSTDEVQDSSLFEKVRALLDQINDHFTRRYNINYSVPSASKAYDM